MPGTAFATTIEGIAWEHTNPDGTRSATLVGARQPGMTFTYAFFIAAGVWDEPHSHSADAHLVVARGELRLGYGHASSTSRGHRTGRDVPSRTR